MREDLRAGVAELRADMRAVVTELKVFMVVAALAVTAFCHTLLFIALSR